MRLVFQFIMALVLVPLPGLYAQDQLLLRVNEKGILNILKLAIQYNTSSKGSHRVVIPRDIYKFSLKKEKLLSNPFVPVLNEISDLNFTKDLDFYLYTSDVSITGYLDSSSLKSEILNPRDNGFDLKLSLKFPKVEIGADSLSICEKSKKEGLGCGPGLKASLTQLKIITQTKPLLISVILRVRTDGNYARVFVRSVKSNLEDATSPEIDVNFKNLDVPEVAVSVDNQDIPLDTSNLKDEVLKRKKYFARNLLSFAGEFMANDLAEMMNVYLINKKVDTNHEIFHRDYKVPRFNDYTTHGLSEVQIDNTYVRTNFSKNVTVVAPNPFDQIMKELSQIIKTARFGISLSRISTPLKKDIELAGLLNLSLNGESLKFQNTLRNSNTPLPLQDLNHLREHDISMAISEPLLNSILDVANSTDLFQDVLDKISYISGFKIKNTRIHFKGNDNLIAVVNVEIDLKKLSPQNLKSWFKYNIASWMERNNNNAIIYFPVEIPITPIFKMLPDNSSAIDLRIGSPFNSKSLPNTFKYPSNVSEMTSTVREGVMEELREEIEPFLNKKYQIDVSRFLNRSGVVFVPRSFAIRQEAYFMMSLDILDINFNSMKRTTR